MNFGGGHVNLCRYSLFLHHPVQFLSSKHSFSSGHWNKILFGWFLRPSFSNQSLWMISKWFSYLILSGDVWRPRLRVESRDVVHVDAGDGFLGHSVAHNEEVAIAHSGDDRVTEVHRLLDWLIEGKKVNCDIMKKRRFTESVVIKSFHTHMLNFHWHLDLQQVYCV